MKTLTLVLEFIALVSVGLLAGSTIYISLVEHPARMSSATALAVSEFVPAIKRAGLVQAALSFSSCVSCIVIWLIQSRKHWLIAGVLTGLLIAVTLVFILPINDELSSPLVDKNSDHARQLLIRWGKLHLVRSLLSLTATLVLIYTYVLGNNGKQIKG